MTCKRGLLHGRVPAKQQLDGVSLFKILSSFGLRKRLIVLLIKTVLHKHVSGSSIRFSLSSDKFKIVCFSSEFIIPSVSNKDSVVVDEDALDALRLF